MLRTRFSPASLAILTGTLLAPATATAHFHIDTPPSPMPWMSEDSLGTPQKLGPCGNEAGGTATGVVTAFQPGQTVQLQWSETVPHDGWYRIAISYDNRADFVDPPVLIDQASGDSADAGIEGTPVAPVLVDGLFPHQAAAISSGMVWSYMLTLPTAPCAKCTIQIIQFMNHHPSNLGNFADGGINPDGYFYHHCIDISIGGNAAEDAGTEVDSGNSGKADAAIDATVSGTSSSSGGSSSSGAGTTASSSGAPAGSSGGPGGSSSGGKGGSSGAASASSSGSNAGSSGGGSGGAQEDASAEPPMMAAKGGGGCSLSPGAKTSALCGFGLGGLLAWIAARRRRSR